MNKVERMQAVFAGQEPDRVPAGFWFHYPQGLSLEERAQAHVDLCRSVGTDIIKIMDDNFGRFFTQGIRIEKASDWRHIRLPGKDCAHYRHMTGLIQRILDKSGGEAMVFPTMWSPFKIASFTYTDGGGTDQQFMAHCKEDPASVLEGVRALTETLQEWARDYLELGSSGLYYSGQFSEPQRFSEEEWARLVKPSDLAVLEVTKEKVAYRKQEGCEVVEMECAALAACASLRNAVWGCILFTADTLADVENYDERNWGGDSFAYALELCLDAVVNI